MLKLWGPSSAAAGAATATAADVTPKAERTNPFDSLPNPSLTATPAPLGGMSDTSTPTGVMTPRGITPTATSSTTSTTNNHHHHLLNHLSSATAHDFKMKPPPLSRNATATASIPTLASTPATATSTTTTALDQSSSSVAMSDISGATPTPPSAALPQLGASSSGQSRGQLHVKVIQAKALNVRSVHSRPYVVVQFENNEFVSRDPISDKEKEVKGVPQPLSRNSSSTALASLAATGIARAYQSALGGMRQPPTPGATNTTFPTSPAPPTATASGGLGPGGLLFGSMSPHNPTWKHEVSL